MNILFLTLARITTLDERGIYTDLLRKFRNEGHHVYIVSPFERREKKKTGVVQESGATILNVKTFNLQKTNLVEKGIGTLAIEYQYLNAIRNHFANEKFDLVLYSTPPITFSKVISFVKKRDNAFAYLLLKDIFPQNAVDMKMLRENGILHRFFKQKEEKLYALSDTIGCMSDANKNYIIRHNPKIAESKIEVNPNSIEPIRAEITTEERIAIRKKYELPVNARILVYGGNLGKPQGIGFLLETIKATTAEEVFFLVVGSGTEYESIRKWFSDQQPTNAKLLKGLPKNDYDTLLRACDVGLIFLHKDFTIPNFPSRLLSYLEMAIPVIAATDPNTDIGQIIEKEKCGHWVISGDNTQMQNAIQAICSNENCEMMGANGWNLLQREYKVDHSYELIQKRIQNV
ncbi:glycosyltransferase family 4 protein [Flavobacterium cerinum]|uniref:Glycosyltransferase family 4 protein n=1 Tax=Flavobacterium cerinum TaxID=2502784 RepID=A0ABY5IZV8_9FLAO|nr:glycosyltransferase family 4 protein [Flavobacterium cerinum]UUC47027.1 glycosyltransferase family 4 protein [Flavobacterium cerinum]